ncbi:Predicted Fe2+/Mn2+ transporter, VIT1/CCC1 family [Kytococcus aerolatus]|uniref:Predicted Fe2+/Mn2+ transporter, VIT1/CCC1 family n=1 Tax=Kytococcus aerolatus TaxID=592308 RepID=A0A212T7Z2_9MICO|nr:VIT family protein [Kytococcus aerolatus]SNC62139.1 Predicted Fe2+/Mn2+ transporter, VIT1/CCC1 family [Kytococcus aerolatus]
MTAPIVHPNGEVHAATGDRLNWLRAGVLGANDGIVSTAGLVVGVAGATTDSRVLLMTGLAGLVSGALSMAAGEYVSVSTQRDAERQLLRDEERHLEEMPEFELAELTKMYRERGVSPELADQVARELTEHDALAAHAEMEFGFTPGEETNPWSAALASLVAFALGALLPLLAIVLTPAEIRVPVTAVSVLLALAVTGASSARLSGSPVGPAVLRNCAGGALAMSLTYGVGSLI